MENTENQPGEEKDVQSELPIERTYTEIDYRKVADKATQLEREMERVRAEEKKLRETLAKTQNDYKSLYETEKQTREEFEKKEKMLRENIVYDKKFSAVIAEALRSGLRKEAQDDIERLGLEEVQVEVTSSGRYNVLGVEQFVQSLKSKKPHWFETKKVNVNPGSPEVTSQGKVTWDELKKARVEAQKSGDWSVYSKLQDEYARTNN